MGLTIISPETVAYPVQFLAPLAQIKRLWTEDWELAPELEVVRYMSASAGQDLGTAMLRRRYGAIRHPWEAGYEARADRDLSGWWIRIVQPTDQGLLPQWVGRIAGGGRDVYGADNTPSGLQEMAAYEMLWWLRKIAISRSYWIEEGASEPVNLAWCPSINVRDGRGLLVGNRSSRRYDPNIPGDPNKGSYLFGGTGTWTRYDALEYVVRWFLDRSSLGGPAWSIGGQVDILKGMTDSIRFGISQTAADVLREIIPLALGIDYKIVPTEEGFEISVFALSAIPRAFAGASMPANPDTVRIRAAASVDNVTTIVARSDDHRYDRIRVMGRRIVVATTLWGDEAAGGSPSLVAKWSSALESAYKAGTGTPSDPPEDHDEARRGERYRPVYQLFGAPAGWLHHDAAAAPLLDWDGQMVAYSRDDEETHADYQNQVRETLSWLPLKEGFDYSTDPPTDRNPSDYVPDLLPAAVWVYDPQSKRYVSAEEAGIAVHVLHNDWGVFLQAQPNHLLALNHFGGAAASEVDPKYDWEHMVATIALETDQRLQLIQELPDATGDGSTLDLVVEDAECWVLSHGTVVGTDAQGQLLKSGDSQRVLRNDASRLAAVMAGAIARYYDARARAEIVVRRHLPWSGLIGQVLTVVDEGGTTHEIQAPITMIDWVVGGPEPVMIVRTGFAR